MSNKPFNESVETFLSLIKYFLIFIAVNNLIWAAALLVNGSSISTDADLSGENNIQEINNGK